MPLYFFAHDGDPKPVEFDWLPNDAAALRHGRIVQIELAHATASLPRIAVFNEQGERIGLD